MELKHLTSVFTLSTPFSALLINWYSKRKRPLPWRKSNAPYRIWLSEIILQQTRVEQGLPYYMRFIHAFPTVENLANASEEEVLKLWQGLGYYSRARNLHKAAQQIVHDFNGDFPTSCQELLKLKGVGPYTAAAIASICFNEPVAVVDGNVFRLLGRLFAIDSPIDTAKGKALYQQTANKLIDKTQPGDFNQAMMDFGATVCTPRNPRCMECPLQPHCAAWATNSVKVYPVKSKSSITKPLFLHFFVIRKNGGVFLRQRPEKGIWANLFDFPSISSFDKISEDQLSSAATTFGIEDLSGAKTSGPIKHQLTHRKIMAEFSLIDLPEFEPTPEMTFISGPAALRAYPLPKLVERYLSNEIFTHPKKIVT